MYLGRIVEEGPVPAIFEDPLHPYTRLLKATSPVPDPERTAVGLGLGGGQAGADGVAGPQQGAEVGLIGHPQRGHDEVVPAAVLPRPPRKPVRRNTVTNNARHRNRCNPITISIAAAIG